MYAGSFFKNYLFWIVHLHIHVFCILNVSIPVFPAQGKFMDLFNLADFLGGPIVLLDLVLVLFSRGVFGDFTLGSWQWFTL